MNEHLPRWIWASATQFFEARRQGYFYHFETYDRLADPKEGLEFRMDGPDFLEPSKGTFLVDIGINILVTCIKDDVDAFKMQKMIGVAFASFENSIPVYKFGQLANVDNASELVGCLNLRTPVLTTNFGQIRGTDNALVATVEGYYRMILN